MCNMALQGHPRSLILAPIESACATSYWSSIVTLVLSRVANRPGFFETVANSDAVSRVPNGRSGQANVPNFH